MVTGRHHHLVNARPAQRTDCVSRIRSYLVIEHHGGGHLTAHRHVHGRGGHAGHSSAELTDGGGDGILSQHPLEPPHRYVRAVEPG